MSAILRLEGANVLRARWLVVSMVVAVGLAIFFVAMATRESAVIAFTGFGRVVTGTALASLLFVPLLAVFSTAQSVPQARQQGVLEWVMSHPLSRNNLFWGMFGPRLLAILGPVLGMVGLVAIAAAVMGQPLPWNLAARLTMLLVTQAFCFAALGMWVSVRSAAPEHALLRGLILWMVTIALYDFALIGVMLRFKLMPAAVFFLAAINPVQAGRLGILAGTDPDFSLLGPVGTWMALNLGATGTWVYALAWPTLLGLVAIFAARWSFVRRDLM